MIVFALGRYATRCPEDWHFRILFRVLVLIGILRVDSRSELSGVAQDRSGRPFVLESSRSRTS